MMMSKQRTLEVRQAELQKMMTSPGGRKVLEALASLYQATSGKTRPPTTSVITFIIVHERSKGLITG
jgi:hypothetical protein